MKSIFIIAILFILSVGLLADGDKNMSEFREFNPTKIGNPLPIRAMEVRDGVICYRDGSGEVALWGTNYLPMSWAQYVSMKKLGADMKKSIDEDLANMKSMGVGVLRVHIFDREICDINGNLIQNDHLDLLEYLIAQCKKENIYVFITLLSWWSSPVEAENNLSANYTKMAMLTDPIAIKAQENYLKQLLNRKNPYSNVAMKDDKAICIFEIFNEPWYWWYSDITDKKPTGYRSDQTKAGVMERDINNITDMWQNWLKVNDFVASEENFYKFRYEYLKKYINNMTDLMRETGVKQPIGWSPFELTLNSDTLIKDGPKDICEAIRDSRADFFTGSDYLGGFDYRDDKNNMKWLKDLKITGILNSKASVIYEFDATGTYTSAYLYPGMSKKFRNMGAQIACQFQYDSKVNAAYNVDWVTHYLNYYYTPEKTVSFIIAGQAFQNIPRGTSYDFDSEDELVFGDFAVSYSKNISIMSTKNKLYHSAAITDYMPLKLPVKLDEIIGVGSSPFVKYEGTGMYTLNIKGSKIEININPDAVKIYNCMNPMTSSFDKKTVDLEYNTHTMTLNIPGFEKFSVKDGDNKTVKAEGKSFSVTPGKYILYRK